MVFLPSRCLRLSLLPDYRKKQRKQEASLSLVQAVFCGPLRRMSKNYSVLPGGLAQARDFSAFLANAIRFAFRHP